MASAFRPVNSPMAVDNRSAETATTTATTATEAVEAATTTGVTSPLTPRPDSAPESHPDRLDGGVDAQRTDDATTPTRASFGNALAAQKPLPTSPFPQAVQVPGSEQQASKVPQRENSQHSRKSRESEDVDMDDSDGDTAGGDDQGGSDDESVNGDGTRSSKKKKSQRFYCTDYPPCNLSFTRSEHLARHIRKHTGERPFQCHCSRRFSRLDNLRQHAQTVHINEDIPLDSLAATGSRFQRQMRTERVRPTGSRARASTGGSAGGPMRGHSKSLSTSSITSVSSIGSAYGATNDARRRPPPLVMADPRSRLSIESYRSNGESSNSMRPVSPSDFSAPPSATFSTGQSSPRWASGFASPTSTHSRSQSMYASSSRAPGRRLSVPSSGNPFSSPHGPRASFGPGLLNSSNSGAFSPASSSFLASPTASTAAWSVRRDSMSNQGDEAWRRRTWHPDTRNFNQPGSSSQPSSAITPTPLQPNPIQLSTIAGSPTTQSPNQIRLPGIESFGPLIGPRGSSPSRHHSPMVIDSDPVSPPPAPLLPDPMRDGRNPGWDAHIRHGINRLDITSGTSTPPRDGAGAWANEANKAVQEVRLAPVNPPTVRFENEPYGSSRESSAARLHQHTLSAPSVTSRDSKRHGWYHGPVVVHAHGQQHGDKSMTDRVERMVHPNISGFSGFPARDSQPVQQQTLREEPETDGLKRLEALVAVATSEGSTATAAY